VEPTHFTLSILFEDDYLLVLNKPSAQPTQADPSGDLSVLEQAQNHSQQTLFLINRLDRPTSGIVLFAKTKTVAAQLSEQVQSRQFQKKYWAIVGSKPPKTSGTLVHFLQKKGKNEHESAKVMAFDAEQPNTQRAELRYTQLAESDRYFLLEIELITGRMHQIRAQLAAIGSPIKGDVKYGARRSNPNRGIHLHALELGFEHPISGEKLHFKAPLPIDPLWSFFDNLQGA
jgi:23S rRNA pseudouridine1911/1915/1917 synthase